MGRAKGHILQLDYVLHSANLHEICIFFILSITYRQRVWVIANRREWGSDSERHRDIKDISERVGQQLHGGSAASIGPGGLASNQSGFDVYWQRTGLNWENCISFVFNEAVLLSWPPLPALWIWQNWNLLTAVQHYQLQVGDSSGKGEGFVGRPWFTGIIITSIISSSTTWYACMWFTWRHSGKWN